MSGADLDDLLAEIQALRDMTIGEVRGRYVEVMGKPTRSFNGPALRHTDRPAAGRTGTRHGSLPHRPPPDPARRR